MLWVGPLSRSGFADAVRLAAARAMVALRRWDVIVMPAFEGGDAEAWSAAFRALGLEPAVQRLDRTVLRIERLRPFEDSVSVAKSRNLRRNVRRAQAAARDANLTFEILVGFEAAERKLELIQRIARSSWKHEGRTGQDVFLPYDGEQQTFFERLIRSRVLGVTPLVAIASEADKPVCLYLCLEHSGTLTTLLTFWNGRCAPASPGMLLLGRIMDWAVERGLKHIDLNATHEWLRHFADERRLMANVVVFAPTRIGSILRLASGAAKTLRQAAG
jgi:CelD/BcsL family acetyltransferase involved in cellulose biosynthesis